MNDLIKNTQEAIQQNDAVLLKECQETDAALLQEAQKVIAEDLHMVQHETDVSAGHELTRRDAASALLESQSVAADALKTAHADHAENLKKSLDEKDQVLSWVTGAYSVEDNTSKE